jgi:hypothetical protein
MFQLGQVFTNTETGNMIQLVNIEDDGRVSYRHINAQTRVAGTMIFTIQESYLQQLLADNRFRG